MIMADEMLAAAAEREARQIDEALFFALYAVPAETRGLPRTGAGSQAGRRR